MGREKDTRHGTARHDVRVRVFCAVLEEEWNGNESGGERWWRALDQRFKGGPPSIHPLVTHDTVRYMDRSMFHIEQRIYRLYLNRRERLRSIPCRDCTVGNVVVFCYLLSGHVCTAHGYTYRTPFPLSLIYSIQTTKPVPFYLMERSLILQMLMRVNNKPSDDAINGAILSSSPWW